MFANAISRTVDATDSVFFFREIGAGAGTPLIFLNHLTDDVEDWDPDFVAELAVHHRIIIFDQRAVGGSAGSERSNISDLALDAIKFIGALGLKLVDLVGFSMGGFVAQRIVQERPDLVRRVFLARMPLQSPTAIANDPGCTYISVGTTSSSLSAEPGSRGNGSSTGSRPRTCVIDSESPANTKGRFDSAQ